MSAFFLSDCFFVIGSLAVCVAAFCALSEKGAFDGTLYLLRVCFVKEKRRYAEFLKERREKPRKRGFIWAFPLGAASLLLSAVLFAVAV